MIDGIIKYADFLILSFIVSFLYKRYDNRLKHAKWSIKTIITAII